MIEEPCLYEALEDDALLFRMNKVNTYYVLLHNGKELHLTREEDVDKSAIGLWKYSGKVKTPVYMDFNEGTLEASSICFMGKEG